MTVKIQKKIEFNNTCNCIVDYNELENAILWYIKKPVQSIKKIYIHGNYSCCSNNSIDIIYDLIKADLVVKE